MRDDRDTAEWDAEIEAEFQRLIRTTKAAGKRTRGRRHIGAPLEFLADVCRSTEGRTALVVALCVYRRTLVCRSRTVTLPAADLAELGITRQRKQEALTKLQAAELIEVERSPGRTARVTLLWGKG